MSIFIQLGDSLPGQGNLRVWPGTHSPDTHQDQDPYGRKLDKEDMMWNRYNKVNGSYQGLELAPLQSGNVIVYDATLFHQGTSNMLDKPRVVLVLSGVLGMSPE